MQDRIIVSAREWLGTPYQHQASLKNVGCDCLGLLRGIWRDVYGAEPERVPPYTPDWAESMGKDLLTQAASRWLIPVGDNRIEGACVLLFRWRTHLPAKHCAIATSSQTMIHAHDGARVTEIAITPWWRRHLASVWRFPACSSLSCA